MPSSPQWELICTLNNKQFSDWTSVHQNDPINHILGLESILFEVVQRSFSSVNLPKLHSLFLIILVHSFSSTGRVSEPTAYHYHWTYLMDQHLVPFGFDHVVFESLQF
uniref:Uncharacterized protein n=1 Tax=Meloidogyne enterolobii TaxID=390850 RepID=A0A6V7X9H2_MELEN|nr:unnamed protein product [Meloidogyne enterolobii]